MAFQLLRWLCFSCQLSLMVRMLKLLTARTWCCEVRPFNFFVKWFDWSMVNGSDCKLSLSCLTPYYYASLRTGWGCKTWPAQCTLGYDAALRSTFCNLQVWGPRNHLVEYSLESDVLFMRGCNCGNQCIFETLNVQLCISNYMFGCICLFK